MLKAFTPQILICTHQHKTAFENILGKEEIARNEQFLLFPQLFLLSQIIVSPFVHIFDIISLFTAELEDPKIGISGKGLSLLNHSRDFKGKMLHLSFQRALADHKKVFLLQTTWFAP